jgi:hypothetical protein
MSSNNREPIDYTRIQKLYNEAESFIKRVENHRLELVFPAVNELRYAGHHLLNALAATDNPAKHDSELRKAEGHCQRAMYEASESGLTYFLGLLHAFADDFRKVVITQVVPDYLEILALARETRSMLVEGRLERSSAETHASQYMEMFTKLESKIDILEVGRSELNKIREDQQKGTRRFLLTTGLVAIGVIFSGIRLWMWFLEVAEK